MQLIVAQQSFYPSFKNLKQNFGDSEDRILWRAKQVVDYAFLFSYSHDLSEYYLQLEDDVISSPEFVKSIQGFLEIYKHKHRTTLEFSEPGFIGKLLRSSELAATFSSISKPRKQGKWPNPLCISPLSRFDVSQTTTHPPTSRHRCVPLSPQQTPRTSTHPQGQTGP